MLNTEDAKFYYHDVVREQIDLAVVMKKFCGKRFQHSKVEAWSDMGKLFDGLAKVALEQFMSHFFGTRKL